MKKLCIFLSVILLFCGCNSSSNLLSSLEILLEQKQFNNYTENLFCQEVSSNTLNLHYTLAHPEHYNIKNSTISLGSYTKDNFLQTTSTLENISAALDDFDYPSLTTAQQLTYDVLKDYCQSHLSTTSFYYYNEPLRSSTGIHAELPILLSEYTFYDQADVIRYLSLLSCIEPYFQELILYEQEKSLQGLFMPDFAADAVIDTCKRFIENPEDHYLISTFNKRIDMLSSLSEKKKQNYKEKNQQLVLQVIIPTYKNLSAAMEKLKGTAINTGGLCHLPQGKAYYSHLVHSATGSSKTIEELQKLTETQRIHDLQALQEIYDKHPELLNTSDTPILEDNPVSILTHLQTAMQKDFSPAKNTDFTIHYIDASMEETLAPAFYLTAPIDQTNHNVIYINKRNGYSGIQLFTTLAHEGYPGHLYQTTESYEANIHPLRCLFNYPGFTEGWATYVEMLSYQYAGLDESLADMHMHHQSAILSLYATADMGIHADGWTYKDTLEFFSSYGIRDQAAIKSIYELIIEEPAHYLKYYIGYLEFLELKKNAQLEFGENYSNRTFHDAILRIGPAPFSIVKKYLPDYYAH